MSFRCIEYLSKLVFPVVRGHNVCRPFVTLLGNNAMIKSIQMRQISTETRSYTENTGLFQKFYQKVKLHIKKYRLRAAGYYLYESVADQIDYITFMKELRMQDSFHSWFLVMELHVWMLMSALMGEPTYGRYLRNYLVEAMWNDISTRTKKLGREQPSIIRTQIKEMSEEFQAALVNYDEGLLSSDTVLAGAIWRRLLLRDPNSTVSDLEVMVKYIRKTMIELDKLDVDKFLKNKNLKWISLNEIYADLSR